jgi:hypothetical protein
MTPNKMNELPEQCGEAARVQCRWRRRTSGLASARAVTLTPNDIA